MPKLGNLLNLREQRERFILNGQAKTILEEEKITALSNIIHPKGMRVKVKKIVNETAEVKSFYLEPVNSSLMPPFLAGQFITLCVTIDGRTYKRPYSITSKVNDLTEYRITIKKQDNGVVSSYMFREVNEGDLFNILGPFGHFTYEKWRDQEDVVLIAGGSGITPFMAYLQDEDFLKHIHSLTLLVAARFDQDIIFKKEIDDIKAKNSKISVTYILSEQKREGYEYGLIDEEKLLKLHLENKSIFVSGPLKMYFSLNEIFKKLDLPNRFIRHDLYRERPENLGSLEHTLTIITDDKVIKIPCFENETLITSMEKGRVKTMVHCTVGSCGFCLSKLISGEVKTEVSALKKKDLEHKYIHPCVTYPLSDVTIEIPIK